jgi:hypothetical protein
MSNFDVEQEEGAFFQYNESLQLEITCSATIQQFILRKDSSNQMKTASQSTCDSPWAKVKRNMLS